MTRRERTKDMFPRLGLSGKSGSDGKSTSPSLKPDASNTASPEVLIPASKTGLTDQVILVHGMLAGQRSMNPLESRLSSLGYHVINWKYPTLGQSMRVHADRLLKAMRNLPSQHPSQRIHFVGHSMGCIIVRLALLQREPRPGCRFVMLAPPNHGSRLTKLPVKPIARWFPHLEELSVDENSLVNQLPDPAGIEVGVIAAAKDRVVELESTHLDNQQDHLVIATTHQRLPSSEPAIQQAINFLQHGRFEHVDAASSVTSDRKAA